MLDLNFKLATLPDPTPEQIQGYRKLLEAQPGYEHMKEATDQQIETFVKTIMASDMIYLSTSHQVNVRTVINQPFVFNHLSIKTKGKDVITSLDDLQTIKDIIRPGTLGVELYPSEFRLVDTSNQYHVFSASDTWADRALGLPECHRLGLDLVEDVTVIEAGQNYGVTLMTSEKFEGFTLAIISLPLPGHRDWRKVQTIKNAIFSNDQEAVLIFPVKPWAFPDAPTQPGPFNTPAQVEPLTHKTTHLLLWVSPPGYVFPFGFMEKLTFDEDYGTGAKQRGFDES